MTALTFAILAVAVAIQGHQGAFPASLKLRLSSEWRNKRKKKWHRIKCFSSNQFDTFRTLFCSYGIFVLIILAVIL